MDISPNNFPEAYQSMNQDGVIIDVNDEWLALLGYQRHEVIGKFFGNFLSTVEKTVFKQRFEQFKKNRAITHVEFLLRHRDGHYISCSYTGKISVDDSGKVITQCLLSDNTEVLKYKSFYEEVFHYSTSAIVIYEAVDNGEDFVFVDMNHRVVDIEKIPKEQMIGQKVTDVFPIVKQMAIFKAFKKAYQTGKTQTVPVVLCDKLVQVGYRSNTIIRLPSKQLLVIYNDETELEYSRRMLKTTMNTIESLVLTTISGKEIYWCNNHALKFLACQSLEEFKRQHDCICDLFIEEPENKYIGKTIDGQNWLDYTISHQSTEVIKAKIAHQNQFYVFTIHAHRLDFDDKQRFVVVMDDISNLESSIKSLQQSQEQLLKSTQELAETKSLYQDFFKDAPIPYQALDKDGLIIKVNDKWCELTGCDEASVVGKNIREFLTANSLKLFESEFKNFYQQGVIDAAELSFKNKKTGQITPVRVFGNITYNSDGSIFHANCLLYDLTKEKEQDLKLYESFESVMDTFVNIMEEKDVYTAGHSRRVANYCKNIAINIGYSDQEVDLLYRAGQLHDIGKIVTPESILLKPSQFTDQEYVLMKEHANTGYNILKQMSDYGEIAQIIRHHHERFDGKGYPDGLAAKDIPLSSRIMTIADAFDAMTTNRVYKPRLNISQAIDELSRCSGTQFDPDLIAGAKEFFTTLKEIDNTQAIPYDNMTQYRFAYYFKDGLTQAYNGIYLDIFLSNNRISEHYQTALLVNLHGLHQYNKKYGWKKGDEVLIKLVDDCINYFNTDIVFRLHGDKFILLIDNSLDADSIKLPGFSDPLLSISQHQHKFLQSGHYSIDSLFHYFYH